MVYKTLVIDAARKTRKMAAAIEKAGNKMAQKGWDLMTFSFTKSGKAILLFCMDDYYLTDEEFCDSELGDEDYGSFEICDDEQNEDEGEDIEADEDELEVDEGSAAKQEAEAEPDGDMEDLDADIEKLEAVHLETEAAAEPEDLKKEEAQEESECGDAEPTETEQHAAEAAGEAR